MKKIGDMQQAILEGTIYEWRTLKTSTRNHELSCNCVDCSKRRRLGAKLTMPYTGSVNIHTTSLRED